MALNRAGVDLFAAGGLLTPLNVTIRKGYTFGFVYTGAAQALQAGEQSTTCVDWSSGNQTNYATTGLAAYLPSWFAATNGNRSCGDVGLPIYCLQN